MSQPAEIGIVAAMQMEIRPLISSWARETVSANGRDFKFFRHNNAVAVCCGTGYDNAWSSTKVLVEQYAPKVLLSVGFAGALDSELRTGDVYVPGRIINDETSVSFDASDAHGTLVTTRKVAGRAEKLQLASRWSAVAVDMEAAAVAEIAQERGCQFAAIKAISDDATTEMDFVGRFVEPSGFRTGAFLAYVAPRPRLWSAVRQLRINSKRASSNLSSTLATILSSSEGVIGALATFAREHAVSIA
jgi:adenosylhomocysteine nucleosidase